MLVVEDNAVNQEVALNILAKLGVRADAVNDGIEALRAFSAESYDLVLMDLRMPNMDGLEATRRIRALESTDKTRNQRVPIVVVTAHTQAFDRDELVAAGMDDFLSKPVTPQTLLAVLMRWLDPELTASASASAPSCEERTPACDESSTESSPVVLDRGVLMRSVMDDEALAYKVLGVFFKDARRRVALLPELIGAGDQRGTVQELHTIKGAASLIGGARLGALTHRLEQEASRGALQDVLVRLPELDRAIDELEKATCSDAEW